jgi:hypothetical protein
MPAKRKKAKKRPKLNPRAKKLASKFIPQEARTRKYKRSQYVAIGISRAVAEDKRIKAREQLKAITRKYSR